MTLLVNPVSVAWGWNLVALIDWGAIVQPRWSCTTLSNTAVTMKPGGAIIDLLGTASKGHLISPGAWRRVQILLRQVCCIAACQRVCLSTLPVEQERLSSDNMAPPHLLRLYSVHGPAGDNFPQIILRGHVQIKKPSKVRNFWLFQTPPLYRKVRTQNQKKFYCIFGHYELWLGF